MEKIREAKYIKYTEKVEELTQKIRELKGRIPKLQEKLKIAIEPRQQGKYVTEIQKTERRVKRYIEKLDDYKRKLIQMKHGGD